jgi:hypothetical protein
MYLPSRTVLTQSLILLAFAAAACEVRAQAVPGALPGPGGWAPPSIGVRLGFDNRQREEILGAQVRVPVVPSGALELMGSADITFLRGLKEYQYSVEGVYVWDGRAGGLYGGAGLGFRDTLYPDSPDRRTELGYTIVAGIRFPIGLVVPQVEYRWIVIGEAPFTFQNLSIGLNLALWRPVPPR